MGLMRQWELKTGLLCVVWYAIVAVWHWQEHLKIFVDPAEFMKHQWAWWTTLHYLRFTYALFAFPYLLLIVPGVAEMAHRARRTGYDELGMLVPALSTAEMHSRWLIEDAVENVLNEWDARDRLGAGWDRAVADMALHHEESILRRAQKEDALVAARRRDVEWRQIAIKRQQERINSGRRSAAHLRVTRAVDTLRRHSLNARQNARMGVRGARSWLRHRRHDITDHSRREGSEREHSARATIIQQAWRRLWAERSKEQSRVREQSSLVRPGDVLMHDVADAQRQAPQEQELDDDEFWALACGGCSPRGSPRGSPRNSPSRRPPRRTPRDRHRGARDAESDGEPSPTRQSSAWSRIVGLASLSGRSASHGALPTHDTEAPPARHPGKTMH